MAWRIHSWDESAQAGSRVSIPPLAVVKANHGRDFGWLIERNGVVLGQLTDERFADQFWSSYALDPPHSRRGMLAVLPAWPCRFIASGMARMIVLR